MSNLNSSKIISGEQEELLLWLKGLDVTDDHPLDVKEALNYAKRLVGAIFGSFTGVDRKKARELLSLGLIEYKRDLYQKEKSGKDIELFSQALDLVTDDPWYYFFRGRSYFFKLKEFDKALSDFNRAIALSEEPLFYGARGALHEYLKEHAKAYYDMAS